MNKNNKSNNNFKRAVNELLGYPADEKPESEARDLAEPQFFDMSDHEKISDADSLAGAVPQIGVSPQTGSPQQADAPYGQAKGAAPAFQQNAFQQNVGTAAAAVSMIAPDMAIMGNLSSNTNITICGRVIGNVVCGGSVVVGGDVEGDISAAEIEICGSVSGNITVAGKITLCSGAHVKGDVIAHELYTSGLSEGDIKVEGRAFFQSTAIIVGNVYAKTFEMNGGAKIKGLVKTYN